jgi:hypothetical protein
MDWKEKLEKGLHQGIDSSKRLFDTAKKQAQKLGEQGVLSLEIKQLESKNNDLIRKLGERVYELLSVEGQSTVSARSTGVKEIVSELKDVRELLEKKRGELKKENEENAAKNSSESSETG